jgi:hypothetical protein
MGFGRVRGPQEVLADHLRLEMLSCAGVVLEAQVDVFLFMTIRALKAAVRVCNESVNEVTKLGCANEIWFWGARYCSA